ncbi:MAG: HlyD family type I secretion periplasmic adaptor subunit [Maricaulaceae bacterium]
MTTLSSAQNGEIPRPTAAANLLLYGVAVAVAVLILWASIAELDTVTRAQGRVIPSQQIQEIQNLEGGILQEIMVRPGEQVAQGQVLMRLDPTRFSSEFQQNNEQLWGLRARLARLDAEAAFRPLTIPEDVQKAAPDAVRAETDVYAARKKDYEARLSVLNAQLEQRQKGLAEARGAVQAAQDAVELAEVELQRIDAMVQRGVESELERLRAAQRTSAARNDLGAARLSVDSQLAAVAEVREEIAALREQAQAEAAQAGADVRAEIQRLQEAIPAFVDRVNRTEVRSPIDGVVNRVLRYAVGAVAQPGETLVEIVPSDDTLLVEAEVLPADIAGLAAGDDTRVKITAYDFAKFGALEGEVERIGADAITKEDGERVYLINVRTYTDHFLDDKGEKQPVIPGMIAEVDVLTGKRTILDYVLTPFTRVRDRAFRES